MPLISGAMRLHLNKLQSKLLKKSENQGCLHLSLHTLKFTEILMTVDKVLFVTKKIFLLISMKNIYVVDTH